MRSTMRTESPLKTHGEIVPVQSAQLPTVQQDEVGNNALSAPFVPGLGQNVNVTTNHNIHLSRKEWMFRGIVGTLGNAVAWPFRFVAEIIKEIVLGIIGMVLGIVKVAVLIVAIPTLIWLGLQLQAHLQSAESVEEGTVMVTDQAGQFADGVSKGLQR